MLAESIQIIEKKELSHFNIFYSFIESPFGELLIGSSPHGLCYMAFVENHKEATAIMQSLFPESPFHHERKELHEKALRVFLEKSSETLPMHVTGTPFQIKVWLESCKIPFAQTRDYKSIALAIQNPRASRAIGSALGKNPIALLIPCHRVILSNGAIGEYRWGATRKKDILQWEKNM